MNFNYLLFFLFFNKVFCFINYINTNEHRLLYDINDNTFENLAQNIIKNHNNFINNNYTIKNHNNFIDNNYTIKIPTIWHVIHNNECGFIDEIFFCGYDEDHYYELIKNRIHDINNDFNLRNKNTYKTPDVWKPILGNMNIEFYIRNITWNFNSPNIYWEYNNDMKFSENGGTDVIDPEYNLNIWLVMFQHVKIDNDGRLIAFATYPSLIPQRKKVDGIVLDVRFILTEKNSQTISHEIGHWGNLLHIWGNGNCSVDDYVYDTPISDNSHNLCTENTCSFPNTSSCGSPDMFMNFMSYGNTKYMFTQGQVERLRSTFTYGSYRYNITNQSHDYVYKHNYTHKRTIKIVIIIFIFFVIFSCFIFIIYKIINKLEYNNNDNDNDNDNNNDNDNVNNINIEAPRNIRIEEINI